MHQNRRTMIGIILVVVTLMTVLLVMSRRVSSTLEAGESQIAVLTEQTRAERQRTEDIGQLQQNMQSDEYKEQVAKDKLGLVRDGEIIFKESDK